jgi:hypothetical protein
MDKISWTDRVRNEEVLHRVKDERNIVHTIKRRKVNWIGHILRRNCLLMHVIEGKLEGGIEMTGRRGRRRKQLLDDLKERRRYWKLKEEALDRTMWRTRFGRVYGPVVRQTTERMKCRGIINKNLKWHSVINLRMKFNQSQSKGILIEARGRTDEGPTQREISDTQKGHKDRHGEHCALRSALFWYFYAA